MTSATYPTKVPLPNLNFRQVVFELSVALFLIALNGVFSLSELALVSARKARLQVMADQRRAGAQAALKLAEDPGRFLSTVQIGITLIGVLAGAFSGAALGQRLTDILLAQGLSEAVAEPLGYGLVIAVITYLSVVIGELVPKNLALRNAEGIACLIAPLMTVVSRVAGPVVGLLDSSTKLIFRLFGQSTESASAITEEEIRTVMAEAETAGVIETDERRMIAGVLRLGDRVVRGVMTPRTDIEWIDLDQDDTKIRTALMSAGHARLPIGEGSPDNMIGVIQVRDLVPFLFRGDPIRLRDHVHQVMVVPDGLGALDALKRLREAEMPMALVHDEYGHFEGVVTPADILDVIAGAFRSDEDGADPDAVQREDGSWLLAGAMPADEMSDLIGLTLPERRHYETVGGLVIAGLERLPVTGDIVMILNWRFEVVDMDGRRIDKVLATQVNAA